MLSYFSEKYFRDEKAGNHEENVYANIAATHPFRKGVIKHYRKYGEGPQPVDVGAVVVGGGSGANLRGHACGNIFITVVTASVGA